MRPLLNRRWRIARAVERIGEAIIRLSVRIRNPTCHCNLCLRNWDGILDSAEWTEMQLHYERDRNAEAEGLCTGEAR